MSISVLRIVSFGRRSNPVPRSGHYNDMVGDAAHVEVDPALLSTGQNQPQPTTTGSSFATPTAPKKKKHRLSSSSDRLLAEIRDLNFAVVGSRLSKAARRLEEGYEGRHKLNSVKEMKDFVGKLGGMQSEHQGLRLRECHAQKR
jgi:vacuolar protein sorting-associated protein 33A